MHGCTPDGSVARMAILTGLLTAIVGIAGIGLVWFLNGQDTGATVDFFVGNWSTVVLAVQLVVCYVLTAIGHKCAGFVVLMTALVTVLGKVAVVE